jgi:hypothetical protein
MNSFQLPPGSNRDCKLSQNPANPLQQRPNPHSIVA